jgi:hypothetical protein
MAKPSVTLAAGEVKTGERRTEDGETEGWGDEETE